jgi:phosphoglycerate dehydrogenase-like enzyme
MNHPTPIIPVTEPEYLKGKDIFDNVADYDFRPVDDSEEGLANFIRRHSCHAAVVGVRPYRGPLYSALPEGGLILRFGVGTDSVDRVAAAARQICCANTPGALDRSVAEHTLFLIGALVRRIVPGDASLKQGQWSPMTGDELQDLKLAIIGMGAIGAQVARAAHLAFGMDILVCDVADPDKVAARLGLSSTALRDEYGITSWSADAHHILANADVVSAHLPVLPDTVGYFNAARLAMFRHGSLFVNTARGALVVERDLVAALESGHLAGAALDVYEHEPYAPDTTATDLRRLPNVLMTPHVASNTRAANRRMAQGVLDNLRYWDAGVRDSAHIVF